MLPLRGVTVPKPQRQIGYREFLYVRIYRQHAPLPLMEPQAEGLAYISPRRLFDIDMLPLRGVTVPKPQRQIGYREFLYVRIYRQHAPLPLMEPQAEGLAYISPRQRLGIASCNCLRPERAAYQLSLPSAFPTTTSRFRLKPLSLARLTAERRKMAANCASSTACHCAAV